jgi:hypothetical protein
VAIANQTFMIAQGPNCTYAVSPQNVVVPAVGGTSTLSVTAPAGCEWSAESSVPWLTVAPSQGSGSGTVAVSVQSSGGPSRTATISVAGQTVTVSQGQGCDVTVTPATLAAPAAGRSGTLQVSAAEGCSWAAQSNVPWISVAPSAGSGSAALSFTVRGFDGPSRTGIITVAGATVAVTQASGCTYTVNSTQPPSLPAIGGQSDVTVTTSNTGCEWTATLSADVWLRFPDDHTLRSLTRTGPSTFTFEVTPNDGPERRAQITLRGDGAVSITISIRQAEQEGVTNVRTVRRE